MDSVDADGIGRRIRQIRNSRGKSLRVIAGLAGISAGYLSRIETGERAVDSRALVRKIADALGVAPSEITNSPLVIAGDRTADDAAVEEVRRALLAVSLGMPMGKVQPVDALRERVGTLLAATNDCKTEEVGAALPELIRDLHTTADHGTDKREMLRLLTLFHMQCTQAWLAMVGAPIDLGWQAATEARRAAEEVAEPVPLALAAFGTSMGLLAASEFELATTKLREVELPRTTSVELQLTGTLALATSLLAAAQNDRAGRADALEYAADLAEHTGETNDLGLGFGPNNAKLWTMQGALEEEDFAEAARIAATINPDALTVRGRRAVYWRDAGRALAKLPRQRDRATAMILRAEEISPAHVLRHQLTRSTISELVARAKHDAVGRKLRGMAYRAGLPV